MARIEGLRRHGLTFWRSKSVVLADLLSGVALRGMGRSKESMHGLTAGIERAQRLGLVRTLLDEGGDALRQALAQLKLAAGPARDHLADVLRRAEPTWAPPPSATDAITNDEALKPREIEILRLVGQSMANKRIALTLNLTLETVKWNLKNVFAKLAVSSRYDAMIAARKRGLID